MKNFVRLVVLTAMLFTAAISVADGPPVPTCELLGSCKTAD